MSYFFLFLAVAFFYVIGAMLADIFLVGGNCSPLRYGFIAILSRMFPDSFRPMPKD